MSIIISLIIVLIINFISKSDFLKSEKLEFKVNFISQQNLIQNEIFNLKKSNENSVNNDNTKENDKTNNWYIQIDKISLKAPIQEGTSKEILEDYVGLFEESSRDLGNICLAAHNRGYKNNYFGRIKELKQGDEIKYIYNNKERVYIVTKNEIIENTDWTNLEETEENIITLITCVENEPEYRRCIQGIER